VCVSDAEIAEAVPEVPFTAAGGVAAPWVSAPQQTTAPVPAWIAQECKSPAAIAVAVPALPSTEGGTVACPQGLSPQQMTRPLSAWIAHA
jgi:hypothetical protein